MVWVDCGAVRCLFFTLLIVLVSAMYIDVVCFGYLTGICYRIGLLDGLIWDDLC